MAGSNLTLISTYYTDHSGPSSCLSLDEVNCSVLYVLRPCFRQMMYFVFPESSCILLKIKCQSFQAFVVILYVYYFSSTSSSTTGLLYLRLQYFRSLANVLGIKQHFTF